MLCMEMLNIEQSEEIVDGYYEKYRTSMKWINLNVLLNWELTNNPVETCSGEHVELSKSIYNFLWFHQQNNLLRIVTVSESQPEQGGEIFPYLQPQWTAFFVNEKHIYGNEGYILAYENVNGGRIFAEGEYSHKLCTYIFMSPPSQKRDMEISQQRFTEHKRWWAMIDKSRNGKYQELWTNPLETANIDSSHKEFPIWQTPRSLNRNWQKKLT